MIVFLKCGGTNCICHDGELPAKAALLSPHMYDLGTEYSLDELPKRLSHEYF